ncbi:MAG: helix-turn-helix transcriptional regulator [Chloroflexi bacterium]|nr:helix-turn-helix transcriptional regulator [Chloroflexota bacterium]
MVKSIHQADYALFLNRLRGARRMAGLTQEQVAERLRQTQSFVSKCELGERRVDVVELQAFCQAFGISLVDFVQELESATAAINDDTTRQHSSAAGEHT